MFVIEVVGTVLKKYFQGLDRILSDERWIEVSSGYHRLAIALGPVCDRRIAPDEADDVAELVRTMPGNCESTDRPATGSANRSTCRIRREVVGFSHFRQHLFNDETCIGVCQGIILSSAIVGVSGSLRVRIPSLPRRDEDPYRHWNLFLVNEILQYLRDPQHPCGIYRSLSVLKDQHVGRAVRFVLSWNIDPVLPDGVAYDLAVKKHWPFEATFGYAILRKGIRTEFILSRLTL